jgi:hypothetical protein
MTDPSRWQQIEDLYHAALDASQTKGPTSLNRPTDALADDASKSKNTDS